MSKWSFLVAGYDATANAMNAALLLLAGSPTAMAAIERELDSLGLLKTENHRQPR